MYTKSCSWMAFCYLVLRHAKYIASILSISLAHPANADFIHPGLIHSEANIQYMKDHLDRDSLYWIDFKTRADEVVDHFTDNSVLAAALPVPNILCYRNINSVESLAEVSSISCKEITEFGKRAYTAALYWRLTGSSHHLNAAINIIRYWATNFLSISPVDSLSLATNKVGWAIPQFLNALELLRGTYPKEDEQELIDIFTDRLGNALTRGIDYREYFKNNSGSSLFLNNLNNHSNANTEALMALAIYKDDSNLFDRAIALIKSELRMYIHLQGDSVYKNGTEFPSPINLSAELINWGDDNRLRKQWHYPRDWRGIGSNALSDGMQMETCRDANHTDMGFRTLMYSAHMAYVQGYDIYELEQTRISAFLELHGKWMFEGVWDDICIDTVTLNNRVPTCNWYREDTPIEEQKTVPCKVHFFVDGKKSFEKKNGRLTPRLIDRYDAWYLAYGHINRRLGIELPYTTALIETFETSFDEFQKPSNQHINLTKWEGIGYAAGLFDQQYDHHHCQIEDGAQYAFRNAYTNKYLFRTGNGDLRQFGWKGAGRNKRYKANLVRREGPDSFYTFQHVISQTLIGVNKGPTHLNQVTSTETHHSKNRQFKLESHPNGGCKLIARHINEKDLKKCLAVRDNSKQHFAEVIKDNCSISSGWLPEKMVDVL